MRNISDNELDKLFQDAAQRVEPEFDPGDWEKLSKRIDRSDRINLFRRIAIYLSVALLIIFSTWLGVNYYKGQSDNARSSSNNGIVNGTADGSENSEDEIDANASAQNADKDADVNNGTSTGSSSDETISSDTDKTSSSSENSLDVKESNDIAGAGERSASGASSTRDQSEEKNALKKESAQRKAGVSEQSTAASTTHKKDQNGNAINSTSESIDVSNNQTKTQKPKRTVAGGKGNRDEGSLSASGNSNNDRVSEKSQSASIDHQRASASDEKKSSLTATIQDKNGATRSRTTSGVDEGSNEAAHADEQNDADISSAAQRSSPASIIDTNASAEKKSSASNETSSTGNTGAGVKDNAVTQSNTIPATDASSKKDQVNIGTHTSSSKSLDQKSKSSSISETDTLAIADVHSTEKNEQERQHNAVQSDALVDQSGNTDQTSINADSVSAKSSALKSKNNVLRAGDTNGIAKKSTGSENTTGILSNETSAGKLNAKEPSSQDNGTPVREKGNSISVNDTIAASNKAGSNMKNTEIAKTEGAVALRNNNKQAAGADHVAQQSDSVSDNGTGLKSKDAAIATSGEDKNVPVSTTKNGVADKSSAERDAAITKQNSSATSGLSSDSLRNESESKRTEKVLNQSSAIVENDSTNAKPVVKADSVDHAATNKETTDDTSEKEEKSRESNWYVKLLVSPDFSAIGYSKPGKTGFNIGLTVEYSPAKHWGISTGAIWSKKLYDKNNPGKSYSYGGASFEADYLDGDCRVLDIPINVTYYILPEARLNFYATVGVSSYIMLKENYVYTVTTNNQDYYYYEDYKNENRHWFSMLNISFGLQYRVSPRLQIQAEPFLKAPMSGVGAGKIDLVSAGTFFALKYKINK